MRQWTGHYNYGAPYVKKRYFTAAPQEIREVITVTVLWCNTDDSETNAPHQTGHPFPDSDPNRRHFEETKPVRVKTGNSYGHAVYQDQEEVTTVIEMCGYHWEKVNPFRPAAADKTLALETEKTAWEQGFDAGQNHASYAARNTD